MGTHTVILPDVGEGIAEAELTEWHVKIGDIVKEDDILAAVMTDKAAVEIPCAVNGRVVWLAGDVGEMMAIGGPLLKLEVDGSNYTADETSTVSNDDVHVEQAPIQELKSEDKTTPPVKKPKQNAKMDKPLAAPSVRRRAQEAGVDLRQVTGTGPADRISHSDLDDFITNGPITQGGVTREKNMDVKEINVVGMRRKIAEKMSLSKSRIPHITIVEEIDMSNLEDLRSQLNEQYKDKRAKLTIIPFMMRAIIEAVRDQPQMNALYDDEAGVISQYGSVHIGIATQTPAGLTVPVAKHAEALNPWESAVELSRLATAARAGKATRDELSGSTITITSLGALGAIASTPIINHPEVSIIGINKMTIRPMWDGQQFQPRKMMNISCSFDHRVIDGWDAAVFVHRIKTLLETPAMLFVEG